MTTSKELAAIRRRAKAAPTLGLVVQHSQAVDDRAWLLDYVDELGTEIAAISLSVKSSLAAARLLLGLRLLADGHAKNLGQAIDLAEDLERVRELYPEAGA